MLHQPPLKIQPIKEKRPMTSGMKDTNQPHGMVYRRTFSGQKLKDLLEKKTGLNFNSSINSKGIIDFDGLCSMALSIMSKKEFEPILEASVKKQFADNFIWRFLKRNFKIDLAIPFLTGYYSTAPLKGNLITTVGHKIFADQVGGTTTTPVTAMAYGTGVVAAAIGDTALGTEVARGAATVTNTTTTTTGDTEQWVKTFTAAGTQAITEEGLLDNNTSGGKLLARQVFSAINMILNDTVQFTHKIQS